MQRAIILIYGILTYALFFGTFLYAIGFVESMFVPKAINDGEVGPFWPSLLINSGLLGLFAVQHAIMARPWFKRAWTTIIPKAAERTTFVLAACVILILMFWLWQPMPSVIWSVENPILRGVLYAISFAGFGIVLYSSFLIDHFDLFGLRQVVLSWKKVDYWQRPFMERSLYRIVRHPLMLGFLIAFWVTPHMTVGHLVFALLTTGYIIVGVKMEERDLIRQHGERYEQYRRRVPGILPRPKGKATTPSNVTPVAQ